VTQWSDVGDESVAKKPPKHFVRSGAEVVTVHLPALRAAMASARSIGSEDLVKSIVRTTSSRVFARALVARRRSSHVQGPEPDRIYISHPEGSFYGQTIAVFKIEDSHDLEGFPNPVRSRQYVSGSVGD
jgi:hypothetical protein